jgi:hypothetical protein
MLATCLFHSETKYSGNFIEAVHVQYTDAHHTSALLLPDMDQELIQLPGTTTHFPHHGKSY